MTAETAVVLPVLVLFVLGLTLAVLAVVAQIRCVDAAQAGARAAARGQPPDAATAAALGTAPRGARTELVAEDGLVRFTVTADARLPGLWSAVHIPVRYSAVAVDEAVPP
ncbi:TadE family type IV pilus minor pilin [Yinghuangia seranimata]|uniref:TadE family type IV pilus minor pilin n=1 Tax=Yinghuangia seranimata TaxID=408067 RepID=UPI00248A9B7B|nr:TadE family type IV pilus minor pilin [Yinghuangia seranimata]MDI2127925.1 TadE family type IV pilus minor pilin [Yinghuangia seranimata]